MSQLTTPTDFTASTVSAHTISLTFTAAANASSYTLEYGTDSTFATATSVSNYASGSAVTSLTQATTYYFRIKSVGDGTDYTDSDWSSTVQVTTSTVLSSFTFAPIETTSTLLSSIAVTPGQLIFCSDTGKLYYDTSASARIMVQ